MGKKRIVTKQGAAGEGVSKTPANLNKRKIEQATITVQSTFNNTIVTLSDTKGNALAWASSGSLGFKGAKKGTPFAAAKVGEVLADKATAMGVKDIHVVIKGVGSGRESAIRSFIAKGMSVTSIKDATPVPHNGPKAKKPRRV